MAQIICAAHYSLQALTTDEVMEELKISRQCAYESSRVGRLGIGPQRGPQGRAQRVFRGGEGCLEDVLHIVRERKRREIRPAIHVLKDASSEWMI